MQLGFSYLILSLASSTIDCVTYYRKYVLNLKCLIFIAVLSFSGVHNTKSLNKKTQKTMTKM